MNTDKHGETLIMNNELDVFERLVEARRRGRSVALATVVATQKSSPRKAGARMLVYADGSIAGTVGGGVLEALVVGEAKKAISKGEPAKVAYSLDPQNPDNIAMCCGGEIEVFIDVVLAQAPLIVFGGGHVGEKIARLAEVVGIPYIVADDRKAYASRERFPAAASLFAGPYEKAFGELPIDKETYMVICTHGHAHDLLCLRKALGTTAAYIGVIASKNKARLFREQLEKEGVRVDGRVYSPLGLDLGDSSPGQIALSVMAEIVKLKSGGSGAHKRMT
jgi:xanthine dehydrogenase accessory factor